MKKFIIEFPYGGSWWTFNIYAESFADAQARVDAMCHARLVGEWQMDVPAGLGWIARMLVWWRNFSSPPTEGGR